MGRQKRFEYVPIVEKFVVDARKNPELLCSVKLTGVSVAEPSISQYGLARLLGMKAHMGRTICENLPEKVAEISSMMRAEGLLPKGVAAKEINAINQMKLLLLRLERGEETIESIQVFGSNISLAKLVLDFPSYEFTTAIKNNVSYPNSAKFYRSEFVPKIFELLKTAGIYDWDSYLPSFKRERPKRERNQYDVMMETSRLLVVESVDDLEALGSKPFDSIYYLMALGARNLTSRDSVQNYYASYQYVSRYLSSEGFLGAEPLFSLITKFTPLKFRAYLEDLTAIGQLAPATCAGLLASLHQALDRLVELEGADNFGFIRASGFDTRGRTTDLYKPYPPKHREIISQVLRREVDEIWGRLTWQYSKSDINHGQTFMVDRGKRGQVISSELCTEENLRWYFDHELGSERKSSIKRRPWGSKESVFYAASKQYRLRQKDAYGSLEELYEAWAAPRDIFSEELYPFYCRLLQVTGMNPDSALNLEFDAYEPEHSATLKPCLRYWKVRSTGAKEMHLDIFDAEISWLSKSQAAEVADLFSKLKFLTKGLRAALPDDDEKKHLLFIAAGRGKCAGEVVTLGTTQAGGRVKLAEKNNQSLVDSETGESISITTTRFRASLVSELVDSGVSVREIQLMLGHASITTTLGYLDRMDFNKQSREKIHEALSQIYQGALIATDRNNIDQTNIQRGEIIYKTPLGGCKNIFNPPDFIKSSKSYDGGACSNFNKCLSCENVIITRSHLPDLFALLRDYQSAWGHGAIAATPHGGVVKQNIEILESILGEDSEFDQKELENAKRRSQYIESTILIDGVAL